MKQFYSTATALLISGLAAITAQAYDKPSAANVFADRLISQIADGDKVTYFTYNDASQLTQVTTKSPYYTSSATFTYESGVYKGESYDVKVEISDPGENIVCYITIGENGFAQKSREIETSVGEAADYETYTFEYNNDGHLIKIVEFGTIYNEVTNLIYDNGDILMALKEEGRDKDTYTVEYTSASVTRPIENVGKLMNFDIFGFDNFESTYFYYAGLIGKSTAHLPISVLEAEDGDIESYTYDWTLNSDGYPIQFKEYEGGKLDDTYAYSWIDMAAQLAIEIDGEPAQVTDYYDISGRRHAIPLRGLNILRHADGSATKAILND